MIAILYFQQRNFIYFPSPTLPQKPAIGGQDLIEDIQVNTADGLTLKAWFIPPKDGKPVLLFFHGNGGNVLSSLYKSANYIGAGYGVLMAEYRGYSGNLGEPSEDGLYMDARAYYDWLIGRWYAGEDIVLYGESLGTGVAAQMGIEKEVRAIIFEAPYSRLSDPARKTYFFIPFIDALMHDKFASIDKIETIDVPMLFIIAGQDEVLGAETGIALHSAAMGASKKLVVYENARHNTIYDFGAADAVLEFLNAL